MNSSPRNYRVLVCPAMLPLASTRVRLQLSSKRMFQLLGLMLFLFGSGDQAFSQAPAPSLPVEWTSLVGLADDSEPVSSVPFVHDVQLSGSSSTGQESPLANLRQPDPSGLLTEVPVVEQIPGNTNYSNRQNRSEQTLSVGWNQPKLRHRRVYFEDPHIERGNEQRQFPNVAAGANFVKSLIVFPVRLVTGR